MASKLETVLELVLASKMAESSRIGGRAFFFLSMSVLRLLYGEENGVDVDAVFRE